MSTTRSVVVQVGEGLEVSYERARVLVEAGPDKGRELVLPERAVVVGRGEDTDLRLGDEAVSRTHLRLEPLEKGWQVRDLESKAGTFLDGTRVTLAPLEPGARVRLGETELVFKTGPAKLRASPHPDGVFEGILGESPPMRRLFGLIRKMGKLDLPVHLRGESGTGKEGLARALHRSSKVASGPYEVVDCTLLEREHLRSELFGHVKGSFTGADADRKGAFERADGGTLFLDEVGELPLEIQPTFLRVLEQGEVRPLGAAAPVRVRVRVVSATNRDLAEMAAAGTFREDLYYRLAALEVAVPPLRDRGDDALHIAGSFLGEGQLLAEDAREAIAAYRWPGNVRELAFKMQRGVGLSEGPLISAEDLGLGHVAGSPGERQAAGSLADAEEVAIREALELFDGNRKLAAKHLGIGRSTLYRKLEKLGLA